jgi:hypothetical protein
MSVSSTTTKVSYAGNGSTTVFAYTFKIFAAADLEVIVRAANGTETTKTLTTHYSVSGAGEEAGGNVTMVTAPASGETLFIRRNLTLTQGTDYVENDPFPANSHENALDRLTFITQGIQEELDRAIKASKTNTIGDSEFTVSAADRANKVFAFDSAGDLSVTQELGTFKGDWAAATAYKERDIVKDTSNNNIYLANAAHTSSGSEPLSSNADNAKWDLIVNAAAATSSASAAASSASAAATSASNAASSASAASTSAGNASTAQSAAEAAQSAAEAALDEFTDLYLGSKASDPALDNDGDALQDGALFYDTTLNVMKVYDLGTTTWKRTTPTTGEQANIDTVSGIAADVTTVAGISSDVTTVAGIASDVTAVAGVSSDVSAVAAQAVGYAFSTTTSMADPGSGNVRFDNATIASVTEIAIDDLDSNGVDQSAFITLWDDSTNTTGKGTLTFRTGAGDVAIFTLTALTDNSGWSQLTVTHVSSSGTFSNAEKVYITFVRTGDKGADGAGSGDVSGPGASVTDNAAVRWDGTTGQLVQNSSVTIDDAGAVAAGSLTLTTDLTVSGNVGVGVSPTYKLDIGGVTESVVRNIGGSVQSVLYSSGGGGTGRFGTFSAHPTVLITGNTERMRIDNSSGNVGINNSSPSYELDVTGDINFTGTLRKNGTAFGVLQYAEIPNAYLNTSSTSTQTSAPQVTTLSFTPVSASSTIVVQVTGHVADPVSGGSQKEANFYVTHDGSGTDTNVFGATGHGVNQYNASSSTYRLQTTVAGQVKFASPGTSAFNLYLRANGKDIFGTASATEWRLKASVWEVA